MISFENGKAKVNCNPLKPCERLVFISQPMRGLTEEQIKQRRQEAIEKIRYIIKEQLEIPYIYIHSNNVEIRSSMIKLLKNFTNSEIQYY